jgi:hypothetical protein
MWVKEASFSLRRTLPLSDSLSAYYSRGTPHCRVTVVAHVRPLVSASVSVAFETWTEGSE